MLVVQGLQLLPTFMVTHALLLGGTESAEWAWRKGKARSMVLLTVGAIAFSAARQTRLPWRTLGTLTAASALLNAVHVLLAFGTFALPGSANPPFEYGAADGLFASAWLPLALHTAAGALLIPLATAGSLYTVEQGVSQVRFRMCGWISAMLASLLVLLAPLHPVLGVLAGPACCWIKLTGSQLSVASLLREANCSSGGKQLEESAQEV